MKQILALVLLSALPASAGPKKLLSNIGHEVKQTGSDFVTWKYPMWNLMVLAEVGADLADAKTTSDCQNAVVRCTEYNSFLYGKHPGFGRVAVTDLGLSSTLIVASHWAHTHRPDPYIRTADYWWVLPQAIDIVGTAHAAYSNSQVTSK